MGRKTFSSTSLGQEPMRTSAHRSRSLKSPMGAGGSGANGSDAFERSKLVRHHGYLLKKALFRGLKAHYYSINYFSAKLQCFIDYNDFSLWNRQGQPPVGDKSPYRTYHVVAVDEDSMDQRKLILTIRKKADSSKVEKMVLSAESTEEFIDWINAFHDVLPRRNASFRENNNTFSCDDSGSGRLTVTRPDGTRYYPTTPPPRSAYDSPAPQGSPPSSRSRPGSRSGRASVYDGFKTVSTPDEHVIPRNLVLIGAANGSTVHVSDAKLAQAKYELSQLLQEPGTVRPFRGLSENDEQTDIEWLHGRPDFTLTDLAYLTGRSRWHDGQSLAARVETALRIFVMEVGHKPRVDQWNSIVTHTFTYQVNDLAPIAYYDMARLRHASLGLVAVPAERLHEVSDVFTSGFPLEVTTVFTTSPSIYFAWRQWGAFTGTYNGRKGNGQTIEVSGFGHMILDLDLVKMHSLHVFCDPHVLFDVLVK
ncbi:hypothetical protein Ae201684P_016310 [Aphanomyces euteiches]|uniref:PH domain-containing protein n=1 Tax=Aphanomyces euteiches TaxID=100861 RepID=A0A6G0WMY9_9STRA|nr:hypothetical protein Ae201684_013667 [Aphanomyces euteiches]KAH9093685.1 hypothetical protein Ae201684P_016310 [Aphanomyces euteiches]KAH9143739.1 hypothetical protein AeRB84_012276 [Aphanomyces euteiches]